MDWLDYREKLGIGFSDENKFKYFVVKISNVLKAIADDTYSGCLDFDEYFAFCNTTGTTLDHRYIHSGDNENRFRHFLSILECHSKNLPDYLSYYIALINSVKEEKSEGYKRENFINLLSNMLKEAHIPFDLISDEGQYFVFPKGVEEFDAALVSEPLVWLKDYPAACTAWMKALKDYANACPDNASEVADKFRKTLETFFQEFFGGSKSLENYKSDYGKYLRDQDVPKELSGNLETLLQSYTNFMNNFAKHRDATSDTLLEYLMYQTGNIIRLLSAY